MSAQIVVPLADLELPKSRLKALLDHLGEIEDPRRSRGGWPIRLDEILFLARVRHRSAAATTTNTGSRTGARNGSAFCGASCPYHHGIPAGRWLTIMMNRIRSRGSSRPCSPPGCARPGRAHPDLVAIDGKDPRGAATTAYIKDRPGAAPSRLGLSPPRAGSCSARRRSPRSPPRSWPSRPWLERLADGGGLEGGALVTIDAVGDQPDRLAQAIRDAKADYLARGLKANQPTLRVEIERFFESAAAGVLDLHRDVDKGHGRIEQRDVTVAHDVAWLSGDRRFPGEFRLPEIACLIRVGLPRRAARPQPLRDPLLRLVPEARRRAGLRGRARPLGHRECAAGAHKKEVRYELTACVISCTRDEGRPFGVGFQEQAPNHAKLLR